MDELTIFIDTIINKLGLFCHSVQFLLQSFLPLYAVSIFACGDSFRYSEHHVTCGSAPKTSTTKFARACKFGAKIKINVFSKYYVHAQGSM